MLKRLYVDNYRCLVNFEYAPRAYELLIGANGTGKSSVFDVLKALCEFVKPQGFGLAVFPANSLTRWQDNNRQTFELDVELGELTVCYRLVIEHDPRRRGSKVVEESLRDQAGPLFAFQDGEVALYRDDHSAGQSYPFDSSQSALAYQSERPDNTKLSGFRDWLQSVAVLRLNPFACDPESEREDLYFAVDGWNFPAWYRWLQLEQPQLLPLLWGELAEVMEGFASLNSQKSGEKHVLQMKVRSEGAGKEELKFSWRELSEGQRVLVMLYAAVIAAKDAGWPVLCLDEPDNFVALREIQPWVHLVEELADGGKVQVLIASHHPELINSWGRGQAVVLSRELGGPTRLKPFELPSDSKMPPSEIVAMGWEDE
jgi:predicted ATPase